MKKEGVSGVLLAKIVNFLLPDGFENCSVSALRNATFFTVLFYASARFSDIQSMNINYLRFVNSRYVILGMDKLKNQK